MALKYKNYTWPNDPQTYGESLSREPLYVTRDGVTSYSQISAMHRIISGSGVFFGDNAYRNFRELMALAEEDSPGTLVHPEWGNRYCYFTKLEMDQEPRENFVSYRFEFTQAKSDGTVPR